MWFRSYRDHVIMAFPSFDTSTNLWAPQANISWVVGSSRRSEFVRFARRVTTEAEAAAWAVHASERWVDQRVRTLERESQRGAGRNASAASKSRLPSRALKNIPGALTFEQFKSLMGRSGFAGSERALKKSYMALARLRKDSHRSWAQIKVKVKHSQQYMRTRPERPGTRTAGARLPLTPRDWRRVI
jgi:hypothetical protein